MDFLSLSESQVTGLQGVFRVAPFFSENEGGSLRQIRRIQMETGNPAITSSQRNAIFPITWMNRFQQRLIQYIELPKCDGRAKNWPQFRRDWALFLLMFDAEGN